MYQLTTQILRDGELLPAGKHMTTEEIGGEEIVRRWLLHGLCVPVAEEVESASAPIALPAGRPTFEAAG